VVGICALALLAVRLVSLVRRAPAEQGDGRTEQGDGRTEQGDEPSGQGDEPAGRWGGRVGGRGGWGEGVPAAACTLFLCVLLTTAVVPQTWRPLRDDLARRTPSAEAYPRVFRWLQQHTRPGDVVAGDSNREFVPWVYIDYGVPVLVGQVPHTEPASAQNYRNRWLAWNWLVNRPRAKPAGCLVQHFGVRYVVTSRTHVPGNWAKRYTATRLRESPNLVAVHRDGPVTVWEVTGAGRACQQA
jgi:hypothetical protein